MSWRTYIGEGTREWADENSSEYATLVALAEQVKWRLPAKLGTTDPAKALEFLHILEDDYAMGPSEFWAIWICGKTPIEHPTWEEARDYMMLLSNCCHAPVKVGGDDSEGTHYYVCTACGEACDPVS